MACGGASIPVDRMLGSSWGEYNGRKCHACNEDGISTNDDSAQGKEKKRNYCDNNNNNKLKMKNE
jgi:hypothetical protein